MASSPAPGVNVNITSAASNPANQASTSTWFVLGMAAGPAGVAVPIKSMSDFSNYFGQNVSGGLTGRYTLGASVDSSLLYDALDLFFHEGGSTAWVSRVQPTSTGVAAASAPGVAAGDGGNIQLNAVGKGTWANSSSSNSNGVILSITGSTVNATTVQYCSIAYNGVVFATAGGLATDADVVNWINSLPDYNAMCNATLLSATTILPATGVTAVVYLTGGTDVAVADADSVAALAIFDDSFGPGQISYPGVTTATVHENLINHALVFNRVAVCDGPNTGTAATVLTLATTVQSAVVDPSYGSVFVPWVQIPGLVNTNPAVPTKTVFNRTAAPSGLVAAKMALMDATNDCNVPAAGTKDGASTYAVAVTQVYSAADRGALNSAGVGVIRNVSGVNVIAVYGYRSLSFSPSWSFLANVRMRMQITRDLDALGEAFVFQEIDGKSQIFAAFAGALAGQLNSYYSRGSLYGLTANDAFAVNTGASVNTPTTIAAGQLNAAVKLRLSPSAEFVTINITKYLSSTPLPV